MAALAVAVPVSAIAARAFTARDLAMLDRVADPRLSPDGAWVAYQLRETDYAANKGITGIWLVAVPAAAADAASGATLVSAERRLSAPGVASWMPRWRRDSKALYFLSTRSGTSQVWRLDLAGGDAQPVTHAPLDIASFMLSPDGRHLVVAMDVFLDCDTPECSKRRLDERAARQDTGQLYERLFMRHWDAWSNGTRSQLFIYALDAQGDAAGAPAWLTRGIDADVPSKPFGDDSEFAFTPDGRALIFSARVAGSGEPWSTNFDLFEVNLDASATARNLTSDNPAWDTGPALSPDGKTLAYRATKRPGFESDRFAIMLEDLASGRKRELLPNWDRSADSLQWSVDGRTLYTTADDVGQKRLFAVDVAHATIAPLTDQGTVGAYDVGRGGIVAAVESLAGPAQLYWIGRAGGAPRPLTHHNEDKLAGVGFGAYEQFAFQGWNNDTVHGYVVKPVGYQSGRKYPVAFIIHGGPESAFGNEFHYRWNPQTYAGAGFAVVTIDFHGTPGYGQAFTDAIRGHWGDRPLEDLQKGWKYALGHFDFLDGTRACALGASYGGFMVNWIAGNWQKPESGAWKCLVSHDGVLDARMMYYGTEELWFEEWENQGTAFAQPRHYERFNPIDHVADWRLPMLVIHSARDFRIPLEQGVGAFTALQRRAIPSEFLYFPDESHWVQKPQNSVQWHQTVEAWLKKWTAGP